MELPDPHPGAGQVRVAVRAAGVSPSDWKKRKGLMDGELPQTMGHEAAGVVDELGEGAGDVAVGDRVFGFSAEGAAQAELAVLSDYAPIPPSLDFPGAGLNGWLYHLRTDGLVGGGGGRCGLGGLSAAEQDEVWARWRGGESLRLIARRLGKRGPSVRAFVLQTGGVQHHPPRRAPGCLSMAEREEISRGVAAGEPGRQIAARLGRAPSTVSRELARNGGRGRYRAQAADAAAFGRAQRPKPGKLVLEPRLRAVVEAKLAVRWWPQQIAGWLPLAYPQDPVMRVSHETIYLSLFVQSRGALRRELQRCLRTGRAMRYPRGKQLPQGRGQLRDTLHISQRPAEVADRAVPGHWEGDLVFGRRPSAVGTLVERHSRYVLLFPLPDGFTADRVRPQLTTAVLRLPQQLRRSLTWDQGREMAEHLQFTVDSGVQVYFCDPRSPWQRGTNENTNGLLRQYLPKGDDLRRFDQAALDAIAAELNSRPRQTLGFKTPSQALAEALR